MATPIKAVPILSGEIADDFVRQADKRASSPSPALSPEQENRVSNIMRQLREFKFPWSNE